MSNIPFCKEVWDICKEKLYVDYVKYKGWCDICGAIFLWQEECKTDFTCDKHHPLTDSVEVSRIDCRNRVLFVEKSDMYIKITYANFRFLKL